MTKEERIPGEEKSNEGKDEHESWQRTVGQLV
jgi:hypothetical protein